MGRVGKTVDLGYERTHCVEISPKSGITIGKVHGIGAREMQQDSFGVSDTGEESIEDKGIFLIVADGMGGMSGGEKASMAAVVACLDYFDTYDMNEDIAGELTDMMCEANAQVKSVLGASGEIGGSTAVAIRIKDNEMYWISVGDSHIYVYREETLTQLNQEHVYAVRLAEKVSRGEISEEEAANDPQRKALTSYLGVEELEEIDGNSEPFLLQSKDRVLLMSDGVFNTLSDEEIMEAMEFTAEKAAINIGMQIEQKKRKGQDNYTALVVEML